MTKRDLFAELAEGFDALESEREGKLTLRRTHWSARTVQTMCNLQVENDG